MNSDKAFSLEDESYKGIIKITYKDDHEFNITDAKESLTELQNITKGKTMPILKIPGKYSSIDADARKFISSEEGMKYSTAEAFVTTFLPHRIIGNFYIKNKFSSKTNRIF